MKSLANTLALFTLAATLGCGSGQAQPDRLDPVTDYAESVRRMVMDLKSAEGGPRTQIDGFAENMAEYESEPLGDHKATYDQIAQIAEELKSVKDSISDAELAAKVDELVALTEKLPKE